MKTKKIQLNSVLLQGMFDDMDIGPLPRYFFLNHDNQTFRILLTEDTQLSRTVKWSKNEDLRVVGKLIQTEAGICIQANYIESCGVAPQPEPRPTDVQWVDNYLFKDPEGYWFVTEDEAVLGPYKTQSEAQKAFDTYVKSL